MKLLLKRIAKKSAYTIGKLYVDNVYFCDTLEDTDRGLTQNTSLDKIKSVKITNKTAIPTGTYNVTLNVVSPKYSKVSWYIENANGGRVPRVLDVPGFDGILIHTGNDNGDTSGCILVGENKQVGKVLNSKDTFLKLYKKLKQSKDNIILTIE